MLLLSAYQGAQDYQKELTQYNEMMKGASGDGYEITMEIPKPSILSAFQRLISSGGITTIGAIIGIVIGFDAVSGEREKGTLKFLLTQPLYRDTLINGKLLGFTILIFTVVLISSITSIGIIGGVTGIFPDGDDALRILAFSLMVFLYLMIFAVIGMFFSVFLKQSVDSLLASIAVFIIVTLLIGPFAGAAADFLAPIPAYTFGMQGEEMEKAWNENFGIQQKIMYLSPSENFKNVNDVILNPYFEKTDSSNYGGFGKQIKHAVTESIGMVWGNIVAILVGLVVFFIASYVMFLRQDVG
jgi:ABC-2 type transport system permease protein